MFNNIISSASGTFDEISVVITLLVAVILGLFIGFIYKKGGKYSQNFIISLGVLPTLVSVIIMLVNGNLGTGVAILGAFSLIRFRSVPGNSKEIVGVFYAMTVGLALGCGYLYFAVVITILVGLLLLFLSKSKMCLKNKNNKIIKISIPENLNYINLFDDVFTKYLNNYELVKIKTTNMGSIFDLTYRINVKEEANEKELIDDIRVRNGNLTIMLNNDITESEL